MISADQKPRVPRANTMTSKPRPLLRRLFALVLMLLLIVAVLACAGVLFLRHAMQAQLPQLDGEEHTTTVIAPVTVRRDEHGVPHIQAETIDDLIAAQGYVTASDRLWQMDMIRRMAAGEASEILGSGLLDHDRMQRVLQFRPTAERIAASLSPRDRRLFEDYARGVNAYMEENRGHLPAEFRLLRYTPKPWQPVDSILAALTMIQMLDQQWPTKLERERVEHRLGPTLAADLYPTGSWRDHPPTQSVPDLTQPQPRIPEVPLDESQSSLRDLLRLQKFAGREAVCRSCQPGSNEWAVSGAHTASGRPLLANDMHLQHQVPNIWYQADLRAAGFHAAGVTVPGLPFIVAGHNDHIAWGFTAMYADTQDLYVEKTNPQGEYWAANAWHEMEHDREVIHVRWHGDVTLDVLRTGHGPVLTPLLPNEKRTVALRWTAYDPAVSGIPLYDLNTAANWGEFEHAISAWWAPTLNMIYSDDQDHIGYQAAGRIPLRPGGLAGTPIGDTEHEWQGAIPFAELPAVLDPPNGILATANSRITPDNYPHPLTLEWASPYRNERIWKWLAGRHASDGGKLTRADMLTLQTDIYSEIDQELAQRFAYAIDHAKAPTAQLRQSADLLRSWDGVLRVDSAAPAILSVAKEAFWPLILKPKLGDDWQLYDWPESAFAEEQLITHAPAQWLPLGYGSWDDLLAAAVGAGLKDAHVPGDLKAWRYGTEHTIELQHPLYGRLPFFGWTGTGALPQSGDGTTVKQVGRTFGPSQRFTMDWSDIDASTEDIVLGQSGSPMNPWYRDQFAFWYTGRTFPMPYTQPAVDAAAKHTLRLIP